MSNTLSPVKSTTFALIVIATFVWGTMNTGEGTPLQPSTWEIVSSSGEITVTESDRRGTETWSYPPDLDSGANWIRVNPPGELEYSIAFEGVEGSSFPDGLTHGGTGMAEGGEVFGLTEREDDFGTEGSRKTESEIEGTYDDSEMIFTWSTDTVIEVGHITTMISGTGMVRARRIVTDLSSPN